jgi:hypothetical protein
VSEIKLLPCPICSREIDIEKNLYIPERDWKPTFYDPDSGGDPINIHCECGLEFSTGTYDMSEFEKQWNTRKPMERIVTKLKEARAECKELQRSTTDAYGYMKMIQGIDCGIDTVKKEGAE